MIAPGAQEALISIGFLGAWVFGGGAAAMQWLVVRTSFIVKSAGN
jgi:hypothetical protein